MLQIVKFTIYILHLAYNVYMTQCLIFNIRFVENFSTKTILNKIKRNTMR